MVGTLGKYRIVAELGRGGSAEVHLCIQTGPSGSGFSKLAVLKLLRADRIDDPEFAAMLVDEARITARVRHPNVVQTFEVGLEGDTPFLAMEYLDGLPLHQLRRRAERQGIEVPVDVSILVLIDALAGLHHAHELADYDGTPLNVVHRDVSPHNIFVTVDGAVKVVDFGIAKAAGRMVETQTGVVKGKVRYMSPEQAMGRVVDRRADVFSSAVILWEGIVGKRFWAGRDDLDIVEALVRRTYDPSPRASDPTIPEELDRICRKALTADLTARYATCAELRSDLEAYLGDRIIAARRQLVTLVSQLYIEDRKRIRAVVEKEMRQVDLTRASDRAIPAAREPANAESVGPFVVPEMTSTELAPTLVRERCDDAIPSPVEPANAKFLGSSSPRKRFRAGAFFGATVVALVAITGVFVAASPQASAHANVADATPFTSVHAALASQIYGRAPVTETAPTAAPAPSAKRSTPAPAAPKTPRPAPPKRKRVPTATPATGTAPQGSLRLDTSDPWSTRSRQ